eukprot:scaffold152634_cov31-Tisochrysis_lutea.AAC.3
MERSAPSAGLGCGSCSNWFDVGCSMLGKPSTLLSGVCSSLTPASPELRPSSSPRSKSRRCGEECILLPLLLTGNRLGRGSSLSGESAGKPAPGSGSDWRAGDASPNVDSSIRPGGRPGGMRAPPTGSFRCSGRPPLLPAAAPLASDMCWSMAASPLSVRLGMAADGVGGWSEPTVGSPMLSRARSACEASESRADAMACLPPACMYGGAGALARTVEVDALPCTQGEGVVSREPCKLPGLATATAALTSTSHLHLTPSPARRLGGRGIRIQPPIWTHSKSGPDPNGQSSIVAK